MPTENNISGSRNNSHSCLYGGGGAGGGNGGDGNKDNDSYDILFPLLFVIQCTQHFYMGMKLGL
jgi:hypothetical protein